MCIWKYIDKLEKKILKQLEVLYSERNNVLYKNCMGEAQAKQHFHRERAGICYDLQATQVYDKNKQTKKPSQKQQKSKTTPNKYQTETYERDAWK